MLSVTHAELRPAAARFFTDHRALANAREYLASRGGDTKALLVDLCFHAHLHGAMVGVIYGHSISIALRVGSVRPSSVVGSGDFVPNGSMTPLLFEDIAQPLAYILAINW